VRGGGGLASYHKRGDLLHIIYINMYSLIKIVEVRLDII
jgi:hypothetical protein